MFLIFIKNPIIKWVIKIINETETISDKELLIHLNHSVSELENIINDIVNKTNDL